MNRRTFLKSVIAGMGMVFLRIPLVPQVEAQTASVIKALQVTAMNKGWTAYQAGGLNVAESSGWYADQMVRAGLATKFDTAWIRTRQQRAQALIDAEPSAEEKSEILITESRKFFHDFHRDFCPTVDNNLRDEIFDSPHTRQEWQDESDEFERQNPDWRTR